MKRLGLKQKMWLGNAMHMRLLSFWSTPRRAATAAASVAMPDRWGGIVLGIEGRAAIGADLPADALILRNSKMQVITQFTEIRICLWF